MWVFLPLPDYGSLSEFQAPPEQAPTSPLPAGQQSAHLFQRPH